MLASAAATRWLLNLGCGNRYHPAWVNVDLHPAGPGVRRLDVTQPLPFPGGLFQAVYHSHLLEHLAPTQGRRLLAECRRVLQPGGILRIAVPDLEQIARLYLHNLDAAWQGDADAAAPHRWLVLELLDQATRERPGGEMLTFLRSTTQQPDSLAWLRLGADGAVIRAHLETLPPSAIPSRWQRWRQRLRAWVRGSWRERLVRRLLGAEYELLQVGRFRRAGEIHQTMYDRVSLRDLILSAGFTDFRVVGPAESALPDWADYGLDVRDGQATKPDSLYAEAVRR